MDHAKTNGRINALTSEHRAIHDWYRFVLAYPPHLVTDYLERFNITPDHSVLDPFCGTGTTLVTCKKQGIPSFGIEANPMTHFASHVKLDWSPDPDGLWQHALEVAQAARESLLETGIDDDACLDFETVQRLIASQELARLQADTEKVLLTNSISRLPLHKALCLLEHIEKHKNPLYYNHERLAFASTAVLSFSNLHFGPEVGIGKVRPDAPVITPWLDRIRAMVDDLRQFKHLNAVPSSVSLADARQVKNVLKPSSIDAVITSPPYPNEKDYTRITRLEATLLGFIHDRASLQSLKRGLMRSNTRTVYKGDNDDLWIQDHPHIGDLADSIEGRRLALGKTSGFEKLYGKVTRLYFGGMAKHLSDLRDVLRPGAHLAYVVGDQASYFQIMIRTGQLLGDIAEKLGYELVSLDLFRTRLSTATREQLREEVVVLRWPGHR